MFLALIGFVDVAGSVGLGTSYFLSYDWSQPKGCVFPTHHCGHAWGCVCTLHPRHLLHRVLDGHPARNLPQRQYSLYYVYVFRVNSTIGTGPQNKKSQLEKMKTIQFSTKKIDPE